MLLRLSMGEGSFHRKYRTDKSVGMRAIARYKLFEEPFGDIPDVCFLIVGKVSDNAGRIWA